MEDRREEGEALRNLTEKLRSYSESCSSSQNVLIQNPQQYFIFSKLIHLLIDMIL